MLHKERKKKPLETNTSSLPHLLTDIRAFLELPQGVGDSVRSSVLQGREYVTISE